MKKPPRHQQISNELLSEILAGKHHPKPPANSASHRARELWDLSGEVNADVCKKRWHNPNEDNQMAA